MLLLKNKLFNKIIIRQLGVKLYEQVLLEMKNFVCTRDVNTIDEIWLVEHYKVFTCGRSSNYKDILYFSDIPIVYSDRGGGITYHAPGQQVMYFLLDLRRRKLCIRDLVELLKNIIIFTLNDLNIYSYFKYHLPGIYVDNKKICSFGLRVKNGYLFHGLALNVKMDMMPFRYINPCGCENISMTQISDFIPDISISDVIKILIEKFLCFITN